MATNIILCLIGLSLIHHGKCSYKYYMDQMCGHTFNFSTLQHPAMHLDLTQNSVYGNNMDCTLGITAAVFTHFTFTVESVQTESCIDYLVIRDGGTAAPAILGSNGSPKICSSLTSTGVIYKTFGNKATLRFVSDRSSGSSGFSLHIEAVVGEPNATGYMESSCGQTIDFPTFNLNSFHLRLTPRTENANNLNCSLHFTTDQRDIFEIRINGTDTEKCNHCACDWLDIRDGNSSASPYVSGLQGKICGNRSDLTSVYNTTGNTLSLLFVSDAGDGKAGFDMTITSNRTSTAVIRSTQPTMMTSTTNAATSTTTASLKVVKDTISVNCNENSWTIGINMDRLRKLYPGVNPSDIYLGENRCSGMELAGVLLFQQGIEDCSTISRVNGGVNTFSNQLIYAERDPLHSFIIRHYKWTIGVQCVLQINGSASGSFQTSSPTPTGVPSAQYPVNISFFLDPNFHRAVSGNPLRTAVGAHVYVKVFTTATDWNSIMNVRTCYTMPSRNATRDKHYNLIKDGCEVDTNTHIISQSTHEMRFVFDAFEYTGSHDGLYMNCDAIFCSTSDWSSQCRQACVPVVKRVVTKE